MPALYMEKDEGTWMKFWRITRDGAATETAWGKVGTNGRTSSKAHKDDAAAIKFYEKMIDEKRTSGYADAVFEGGEEGEVAPAPAAPIPTKRKQEAVSEDATSPPSAPEPPAKKAKPAAAPPAGGAVCNSEKVVDNWIVDSDRGLLVLPGDAKGGALVAGFDMDDTIITPASGNVFAKDEKDWKFLSDEVPAVLQDLRAKGYKIVIFTNQAGVKSGKKFDAAKAKRIQRKILAVSQALGFSVQAFAGCDYGRFRKPAPGTWELMEAEYNDGVEVDRARSMYVGDAAGRQGMTMAGRKKDFSCGDRRFASNLGVQFFTPEELFRGEPPAAFEWGKAFDPNAQPLPESVTEDGRTAFHKDRQEVVLNVGYPASGKSSFTKKHLVPRGYAYISRDVLGTAAKCEKALKEALAKGQSAVIDNTSAAASQRAPYIKAAKAAGVPIRCHHFDVSFEQAEHLNALRDVMTDGDTKQHVPGMVFNIFRKNFQQPTVKEGFAEVVAVRFVGSFQDDRHKQLYHSYLLA